jgi:hypothetical protein
MSATLGSSASPLVGAAAGPALAVPPLTPASERPKRCCAEGCKKKLGLLDFACRCGQMHCVMHRQAEAHGCRFDYQKEHKELLQKTIGEAVVGKKVDKI